MNSKPPSKFDKRTHKPKTDRSSGAPYRSDSSDKPKYPRKPAGGSGYDASPRSDSSDKPRFPRKPSSGGPRYGDSPRSGPPSDRPHYPRKPSSGGPRFGDSSRSGPPSDRPRYPRSDSSDRPSYPRKFDSDRRSEGGSREDRPPRRFDSDRRPGGPRPYDRDRRPEGGPRDDRPPRRFDSDRRPSSGPREDRPPRRFDSDRRPGGSGGGGYSSDKPRYPRSGSSDRPSYPRKFDRDRRSEGGSRDERPPRRFDADRKPRDGGYSADRSSKFGRKFENLDGAASPDEASYLKPDVEPTTAVPYVKREVYKPYHKPEEQTPGTFRVYGRKPVLEVLNLDLVRSLEVHKNAHGKPIEEILRLADEKHITVKRVESFPEEEELNMQGVQAHVQPPVLRDDLRRFVRELPESPTPLLLMLDGINDPHNFGAILRSADAAGVNAVIIRERRQAPITDVVVKSSAGAAYMVPIFQVVNLSQTLTILSGEGFWSVAAMSGEGSKPYGEYNWNAKTVLIMGSEGTGVSELLAREADDRISIPMAGKVDSLNVSVATGILLYEGLKARNTTKKS
ncbi:MAG TPA: 23S rRNA (guanosine(2251)-2'-O)-methyltransferase RlmB [bacterium]